jgi:hypothetical protein
MGFPYEGLDALDRLVGVGGGRVQTQPVQPVPAGDQLAGQIPEFALKLARQAGSSPLHFVRQLRLSSAASRTMPHSEETVSNILIHF